MPLDNDRRENDSWIDISVTTKSASAHDLIPPILGIASSHAKNSLSRSAAHSLLRRTDDDRGLGLLTVK
jgi:hypothetical protein